MPKEAMGRPMTRSGLLEEKVLAALQERTPIMPWDPQSREPVGLPALPAPYLRVPLLSQ